jgi:hypothetical protein
MPNCENSKGKNNYFWEKELWEEENRAKS